MNIFSTTPATASQWQSFYAELFKKAPIPEIPLFLEDATHAVFQAPFLDAAHVLQQEVSAPRIVICCDVFSLPDNFTLRWPGKMITLITREVFWGKNAAIELDFISLRSNLFIIHTSNIHSTGTAAFHIKTEKGSKEVALNDHSSIPLLLRRKEDQADIQTLKIAKLVAAVPEDFFQVYLRQESQIGTLLFDNNKDLSRTIHQWVSRLAVQEQAWASLAFQSFSLATLSSFQSAGRHKAAHFVPRLSPEIYEGLSEKYVEHLAQLENQYLNLRSIGEFSDQNLEQAETLLESKEAERVFFDSQLDQTFRNFKRVLKAKYVAQINFNREQTETLIAENNFVEAGIPIYKRMETLKAAIQITIAVIQVIGAIGSLAAGMPVGTKKGADGLQGGMDGVEAAEDAADLAEQIGAVAEAAEKISKLEKAKEALKKASDFKKELIQIVKSLDNLENHLKELKKLSSATSNLIENASKIYKLGTFSNIQEKMDTKSLEKSLSTKQLGEQTNQLVWNTFLFEFDKMMAPALSANDNAGILHAHDYHTQVHKMAAFGVALMDAEANVIRVGNELNQLLLQRAMTIDQISRLRQSVEAIQHRELAYAHIMQTVFNRMLDQKGNLVAALHHYKAAFFYWALNPSELSPSILDSTQELGAGASDLVSIKLDQANALRNFNPAPSNFSKKEFVITDERILKQLREKNTTQWQIPLSANAFKNLERVRCENLKIWLEGAHKTQKEATVTINIFCSGVFQDRHHSKNYRFVSEPLQRKFQYGFYPKGERRKEVDYYFANGQWEGFVEKSADVSDEFKFAYAYPTPFTEWCIEVDKEKNEGIDLSEVTKIVMEIEGTAI